MLARACWIHNLDLHPAYRGACHSFRLLRVLSTFTELSPPGDWAVTSRCERTARAFNHEEQVDWPAQCHGVVVIDVRLVFI